MIGKSGSAPEAPVHFWISNDWHRGKVPIPSQLRILSFLRHHVIDSTRLQYCLRLGVAFRDYPRATMGFGAPFLSCQELMI